MDSCLPDWSTEVAPDFPHPVQRKPFGSDNDLVELLWQNGELVLHNQTNRKQTYDPSKPKQLLHQQSDQINPNNLIQDYDTSSWIDCPIDESFEKEFCADFLSEIPPFDPVETTNKPSKKPERSVISTSDVNQFASPPLPPPPRFQTPADNRQGECSVITVGSSHCASNQVDLSWANSSSRTMSETYAPRVDERRTREQPMTSCSGGSASSMWKTSSQSNDTNRHKRKSRDHMEESDSPSDATEMESAAGNKTSQKSGGSRKSRVAEVHNMSERRRRDRINEKMRALQELIPHSNKSDKASMLDEAIEYMKSLQLQIQLMWMGRGMAPMMIPGMQHYMSRIGMGIAPPMLPTAIQNLMRLSRLPIMNQAMSTVAPTTNQTPVGHSPVMNPVNYQDHMQNSSFHEQYANYMGFHSVPNDSQQTNMFNFGLHSAPQSNDNGSIR